MTPFRIGDFEIAAGARLTVELPISVLANHTPTNLPVHVIHGATHSRKYPIFKPCRALWQRP